MEKEQNINTELENMTKALENNLRVLSVLVRAFNHENDMGERANILELISVNLYACGAIMIRGAKTVDAMADFY